jgi:L-glutamine-phosphate cytidylyltransferase
MQALILAAGSGSRLNQDLPKCLTEVGGRTLLSHQLEALDDAGADGVTVVLGHEHLSVRRALGHDVRVVHNERYAETNSIYSFWLARHAVQGDDVVVLNSDVLFDPEVLSDLLAVEGSAIAVDSSSGDEDEHMKVRIRHGRLIGMSKDLPPALSDGENLGLLHLSTAAAQDAFRAAGELVGRGDEGEWVGAAISEVADHHRIACVDVAGQPWVEIDFPEDLEVARQHVWPAIAALMQDRRERGLTSWASVTELMRGAAG